MIGDLKPYSATRYSGVSWLGEIPTHWRVERLRNVADTRVSNVNKESVDGEIAVRLCNYVDAYKNERITSGLPFMRATASPKEIERFRLSVGDVLITKDSEEWTDIGVPALVEFEAADLLCGYHLAILRPHRFMASGAYLLRALQAKGVAYQFHVAATGVTRFGLSQAAIKNLLVPLPPLDEQAAIVRFLDYADKSVRSYIRAKQKLIRLLEEQKQAIVVRSVSGSQDANARSRQSGIDWLGKVPSHWQIKRLKYVLREVDQRSIDGSENLLSLRMRRGLVLHTEVSDVPIGPNALIGFKKVTPGQLVMNRMRAAIGMFGIAPQAGLVSPDYAVFDPILEVNLAYFLHLFKTREANAIFRIESKGLGTGSSGFMRLYTDRFGLIRVPVPPLDEQTIIVQQIVKKTATASREIENIERDVSALLEYRGRLIGDAVMGKFDVKDAVRKLPAVVECDAHRLEEDAAEDESFAETSAERAEA